MSLQRLYLCAIEQDNALAAAADPACTRWRMAGVYADCLRAEDIAIRENRQDRVDFAAINVAILRRWPKGLQFVKGKAWKLLMREG